MDCRVCQHDPSMRKQWGCEEPSQHVVWATDEEEFYSCPLLWVSPAVVSWYEEYSYYKEFTGAAPCFHKLHPAWLDAMREYNEYYRFFYELVNPKRGGSTDKGLSVLRESFKNRG